MSNEAIREEVVQIPEVLGVLLLRNTVLFPGSVIPVDVGRKRSTRLVDDVTGRDQPIIVVVSQRDPQVEDPTASDVFSVGCAARILKVIKLAKDNFSVILQGLARVRLLEITATDPYMVARVQSSADPVAGDKVLEDLSVKLKHLAKRVIKLMPQLPKEAGALVDSVIEPGLLADVLASNLDIEAQEKQEVLEAFDLRARILMVSSFMSRQEEVLRRRESINSEVAIALAGNQREYVLRQQLKAIQEELGEAEGPAGLRDLAARIEAAELPGPVLQAAQSELNSRLRFMAPQAPDFDVSFRYVDWLVSLPWRAPPAAVPNARRARGVLDDLYHGADEAKTWLDQELAVSTLVSTPRGHALCLVGPPGVGKTTLGRAIGRALGREVVLLPLAGARDEAVVRGTSRTYPGAGPGALARALRTAGTRDPVIVLDDIDKMQAADRGDPRAALLEALDPAREHRLTDYFLQQPIDLSAVLFVATAENAADIYPALRSRLRLIELWGYDFEEKELIARKHLWPRCLAEHGLKQDMVEITSAGLRRLVRNYTREAGVRQLEQRLRTICRQVAKRVAAGSFRKDVIEERALGSYLGPASYFPYSEATSPKVGRAHAGTSGAAGPTICPIDVAVVDGSSRSLHVTGESTPTTRHVAEIAATVLRSGRAGPIPDRAGRALELHVHFMEGLRGDVEIKACGAALLMAMASAASRKPMHQDQAVMGRLTVLGEVLGVPNVHAKILAAQRFGMRRVFLPEANRADVRFLPAHLKEDMEIVHVRSVDQLIERASE